MNPKFIQRLRNYRGYHSQKGTIITHFIGVPFVTFSVLILLGWIKVMIPDLLMVSVAWLGVLALTIYYLMLDRVLGAFSSALLIVLCTIASLFTTRGPSWFSFKLFLITFILGWIFQLVGHAIEGNKPALLDNFFDSVFIAPVFITVEIVFLLGFKKALQRAVELPE